MEEHGQKDDFKRDIGIYFFIVALLAVIVFIGHLRLGTPGIFLIVPIACIEASILCYYFMHLMTKKKTVHLLILLTVVVFLNLLFWPAWDVAYSPRTPSELTVF